jgi:hypothetical protein
MDDFITPRHTVTLSDAELHMLRSATIDRVAGMRGDLAADPEFCALFPSLAETIAKHLALSETLHRALSEQRARVQS